MPASGGLPKRRTFDGGVASVARWTPDGKILYATRRYSTLPDLQLATVDALQHLNARPSLPHDAPQACQRIRLS
jgi:hypothetical protein